MEQTLRQIALNNNAGAFTDILATRTPRLIEAMEDEATTTQGIQVKSPLDGFTTTNVFSFGSQPITIPNQNRFPKSGQILGWPVQHDPLGNTRAADKLLSARSNGASATTLRFIEGL